MEIKVEIDGKKFEIYLTSDDEVIHHTDGFVEDNSTWYYKIATFVEDDSMNLVRRKTIHEDYGAEEASEAASYAIAYLVDLIQNKKTINLW